jgi:hypothetical protein
MSAAAIENKPSQLTRVATNAELQSQCIPDDALASIMAAQVAEEFRKFLLVIALRPEPLASRESVE